MKKNKGFQGYKKDDDDVFKGSIDFDLGHPISIDLYYKKISNVYNYSYSKKNLKTPTDTIEELLFPLFNLSELKNNSDPSIVNKYKNEFLDMFKKQDSKTQFNLLIASIYIPGHFMSELIAEMLNYNKELLKVKFYDSSRGQKVSNLGFFMVDAKPELLKIVAEYTDFYNLFDISTSQLELRNSKRSSPIEKKDSIFYDFVEYCYLDFYDRPEKSPWYDIRNEETKKLFHIIADKTDLESYVKYKGKKISFHVYSNIFSKHNFIEKEQIKKLKYLPF